MAKTISNQDDVVDSRDIIERINELEAQKIDIAPENLSEEEDQELADLYALQEEASASPDWEYGETLIRDSYFEQYAEDLADDIGAVPKNAVWPLTHIDWASAAEALQADYINVDWDGVMYWIHV